MSKKTYNQKMTVLTDKERSYTEKCPYCPGKPKLVAHGQPLYPYRNDFYLVWICPECKAYVGCHENTFRPKGFLANKKFMQLRKQAHALFDPIWMNKEMERPQAYKRMAEILGIHPRDAHIAQLQEEQLLKLIRCLKLRHEANR